ncbi:MAG TPA: hypothetical protein P5183_11780 [Smithellaceae bacterium]|nr:hypothetical protein [Smithellaceae bacterium]
MIVDFSVIRYTPGQQHETERKFLISPAFFHRMFLPQLISETTNLKRGSKHELFIAAEKI